MHLVSNLSRLTHAKAQNNENQESNEESKENGPNNAPRTGKPPNMVNVAQMSFEKVCKYLSCWPRSPYFGIEPEQIAEDLGKN